MLDKEVILIYLQKVQRRLWANRFFAEISHIVVLFLIFLAAFKVWDLFSPFRAGTVIPVLGMWLLALSGCSFWILRRKTTLAQSAASIDKRLSLHDEITTAYWFINNPLTSPWVDGQIRRAAKSVQRLDINRIYPRVLPNTSYLAAGILVLIVILNFSPLSVNHNWFALEAAPAYALSAEEQQLFEQARELLLKINANSAGRLGEIMNQLQTGVIDASKVLLELNETRRMLEEGKLDLDSINTGLEEIARDFAQSLRLKDAADILFDKKLPEAATEIRSVAGKIDTIAPQDLTEMRQSLEKASGHARPGLEDVSEHLKEAASGLQNENNQRARDGLVHTAQDLEQLALQIEIQQFKDEASEALDNLEKAIRRRQAEEGSGQQDGQAVGWNLPLPDDRLGPDGSPPGNEAHGLDPSGEAVADPQREGRPTSLKVQLQQERVAGQRDEEIADGPKEATTQEHSGVEYGGVTPNFRPAHRDVLNQDNIPWDYRPLIKSYFESIHEESGRGR